jgi:hypothetical protein
MKRFLAIFLATTLFAACSGSSSNQPDTEAGLKDAVRSYSSAVFKMDATSTYRTWAKACRDKVSQSEWSATLIAAKTIFEGIVGVKFADVAVGEVTVQNFTQATAEAYASFSANGKNLVDSSPTFAPYAYESGRWVETDCDKMQFNSPSIRRASFGSTAIATGSSASLPG